MRQTVVHHGKLPVVLEEIQENVSRLKLKLIFYDHTEGETEWIKLADQRPIKLDGQPPGVNDTPIQQIVDTNTIKKKFMIFLFLFVILYLHCMLYC